MRAGDPRKSIWRALLAVACMLLCLVLVIPGGLATRVVKAQGEAVLLLSPNPQTFYLNGASNQFSVNLMAQNVVNMQAFEFELSYDPAILEFVGGTTSTWLSGFSRFYNQVSSGYIHLAYWGPGLPSVSGSGQLLTLTFKYIGYGSSQLTFSDPANCKYARPDGMQIRFALQNGSVNAAFDPAITANSAVAGTFSLQGQTANGGVPVTLDDGQFLDRGPFSGVSLNQSVSNLSIPAVVMDVYTITTQQPRYLNIDAGCGKTKAVFGTLTTLSPLKLMGGNAVWTDNVINMQDISLITGVYGQPSPTEAPLEADINFNGTVDVFDLAMAAGNYGMNCSSAYGTWEP
jgi:hypothetical protein